jgi:hypothetical protein
MSFLGQPILGFATRFPYGVCKNPVKAPGSSDALPVADSDVFVTSSGVNAMTLGTPRAGVYPAGTAVMQAIGDPRDDGKRLRVVDTTGHAHTITTAAGIVAPGHHILTFNGTVGSFVDLEAYNGLWYVIGSSGVTAS